VADLFSDRSLSSRFAHLAKTHLQGVENVYTQHTPLLLNTIEQLVKGKLSPLDYPSVGTTSSSPNVHKVDPPPPPGRRPGPAIKQR
jgi:vacuolar protein sorting-associated protein 45